MSCQKRANTSMQELTSYLRGVPENYCTHEFHLMYYASMVHAAEEILPRRGAVTGTGVAPPTHTATIMPPRDMEPSPAAPHAESDP